MFLVKYTIDDIEEFSIYYNNKYGWEAFHNDTFSPFTKDLMLLKLSVSGDTYREKKDNAIELAKDYQYNFSSLSWSYGELVEINTFFETIGKRYGLLQEYRENGII